MTAIKDKDSRGPGVRDSRDVVGFIKFISLESSNPGILEPVCNQFSNPISKTYYEKY
jgi:hypothetical protein